VFPFVAGSFECRMISDGECVLPAEMVFAGAPEAERPGDPSPCRSDACSSAARA